MLIKATHKLSAGVFLAGLALSGAANALDTKPISVMDCQPYGATLPSSLTFTPYGITNITEANQSIICPIPRDTEGAWNESTTAEVGAWFTAGNVGGQVYCAVYSGSGTTVVTTSSSGPWASAGATLYRSIALNTFASGWSQNQSNIVCTLTRRVRLNHFYFSEAGATSS